MLGSLVAANWSNGKTPYPNICQACLKSQVGMITLIWKLYTKTLLMPFCFSGAPAAAFEVPSELSAGAGQSDVSCNGTKVGLLYASETNVRKGNGVSS